MRYRRRREECWGGGGIGQGGYLYSSKQGRREIEDGKLEASSDQPSCPDNHPSQLGGGEIEIKLLRV